MRRSTKCVMLAITGVLVLRLTALSAGPLQGQGSTQAIDLAAQLAAGTLRAVNREVTTSQANPRGVRVAEKEGPGVVWIEGTDFTRGTIEVDVRGRDVMGQSFVGIAFHRKDDSTYEAVYLRPFNFRNPDEARRQNAVQYVSVPEYDWPRLRKEFPSEFENPVDGSVAPTDWVPLRLVVSDKTIAVFVGTGKTAALEVRKLGTLEGGQIGLWAGNNSDGDYANLRITTAK